MALGFAETMARLTIAPSCITVVLPVRKLLTSKNQGGKMIPEAYAQSACLIPL